ncbi:helix-turn-helix transcriptional regulator [Bradyrhizobium cenepequi]|uniref:helix-turn-helix transcriptional regulator n=1 Tax=Bradyrhizobium cenepequi TaxID=2821403 RepID=UPI001CE314C0|nr:DNA-binding protein [Bradyrhizobium cenepequi]MCA6110464.1 DNA-binding protein [Bradyrhizobium cenepequi]
MVAENNSRFATDPLLNEKESAEISGVSMPTFWRWVRGGVVPKPIKLGRLSRWPRSEIYGVIENAAAARHVAA